MYSEAIKEGLEAEIVGQHRAVASLVRGVTRVASGLTPWERAFCAYLLVGPTGTGKTHLVRTLARLLHGHDQRLVVADCHWSSQGTPWITFARQLITLFTPSRQDQRILETPPLSILLIEGLENGPRELAVTLGRAFESGHLMLPDGRPGWLRSCLVILTSSICSDSILDETVRIGFAPVGEDGMESEDEALRALCCEEAQRQFGRELIGRLDDVVLLHRLEKEDLREVLERRFARLNRWLRLSGRRAELSPAALDFLLERGLRNPQLEAGDLVVAHREFVEFPVADLLISGKIPTGGKVLVDHQGEDEHLHFAVQDGCSPVPARGAKAVGFVPIEWETSRGPG